MNEEQRMEHLQELESRIWNRDFYTMTNEEITETMKMMFFNIFLIDISELNMQLKQGDEFGNEVSISIKGTVFSEIAEQGPDEIME